MKRFLSSLNLVNFSGFQDFSCGSFRPITIIGGKNNSGKSTLLEAICFLSNRANGAIPGKLVWNRGERMKTRSLATLFYGAGDEGEITMHGIFSDKTTRGVSFECTHRSAIEFKLEDSPKDNINERQPFTYVQQFYTNRGENAVSRGAMMIAFIKDEYRCYPFDPQKTGSEYGKIDGRTTDDDWECVFYQSQRRNNISPVYSRLFKSGDEKKVLPYLQFVDSRILDIAYDGDMLLVGVGDGKMRLPINVMGDGVVKAAEILSILALCPGGGILCIDDIENGLHYSAMKELWKSIVCLARDRNIQLIVTTHNIEMLKAIGEETDCVDDGEFVYLNMVRRGGDKVVAFPYNHQELAHSLSMNLEVR